MIPLGATGVHLHNHVVIRRRYSPIRTRSLPSGKAHAGCIRSPDPACIPFARSILPNGLCLLALVTGFLVPNLDAALLLNIPSDPADGSVREDPTSPNAGFQVFDNDTSVRVGISGSSEDSSRVRANAFYFFPLPDVTPAAITGAELAFPFFDMGGTHVLDFNLDVWGLGYTATPTLSTDWLHTADSDTGDGVGVSTRTRVVDNLLTPALSDPGGITQTIVTGGTGGTALRNHLISLYNGGASPGDFAIIRLNHDANRNPEADGTPGYSVGFSEFEDGAGPELRLTVIPESRWLGLSLGSAMVLFVLGWRRMACMPTPPCSAGRTIPPDSPKVSRRRSSSATRGSSSAN